MKIIEFMEHCTGAGFTTVLGETGSPDFKRVFIVHDGMTVGRACACRGEIMSVKEYGLGNGLREPGPLDMKFINLWLLIQGKAKVDEQDYHLALENAKEYRKQKLRELQKWRVQNPSFRKRPPLMGPDILTLVHIGLGCHPCFRDL